MDDATQFGCDLHRSNPLEETGGASVDIFAGRGLIEEMGQLRGCVGP